MSHNKNIENNNIDLLAILDTINNLPDEATGVELPDLTEPATEDEVFLNQEYIDESGEKKTGTFTIATELETQDDLLAQIEAALEGKAGGGSSAPTLQDKTVTPTTSTQNVTPDSGYDGLSKVTVNAIPSTYIQPSGTKTVTTNGTHDVKAYESVNVNVASTEEDVTAETNEYTEKITQLATAVTALETELQGKASGGGSVETCTVTISFTFGDPTDVWISGTQLVDGNISPFTFIDYGNGTQSFTSPLTISNIVKNTPLTISGYGSYDFANDVGTLTGCELAYAAIAPRTFAVKVTDTIASVVVRNDY